MEEGVQVNGGMGNVGGEVVGSPWEQSKVVVEVVNGIHPCTFTCGGDCAIMHIESITKTNAVSAFQHAMHATGDLITHAQQPGLCNRSVLLCVGGFP